MHHTSHGKSVKRALAGFVAVRARGGREGRVEAATGTPAASSTLCAAMPAHGAGGGGGCYLGGAGRASHVDGFMGGLLAAAAEQEEQGEQEGAEGHAAA